MNLENILTFWGHLLSMYATAPHKGEGGVLISYLHLHDHVFGSMHVICCLALSVEIQSYLCSNKKCLVIFLPWDQCLSPWKNFSYFKLFSKPKLTKTPSIFLKCNVWMKFLNEMSDKKWWVSKVNQYEQKQGLSNWWNLFHKRWGGG